MTTEETKVETSKAEEQTQRVKAHAAGARVVAEDQIPDVKNAEKSAKTLLADSKTVLSNVRSSQIELQRIGLGIISHVAKHGDIMILRQFFAMMDEVSRDWANQMKVWFDKYGTVSFDDKGEVHFNRAKKLQLGLALDKPWWKAREVKGYTPYVLIDKLSDLYEQADKRLEKGVDESKGDILDRQQLALFSKFLKDMETLINTASEEESEETTTTPAPETQPQAEAA